MTAYIPVLSEVLITKMNYKLSGSSFTVFSNCNKILEPSVRLEICFHSKQKDNSSQIVLISRQALRAEEKLWAPFPCFLIITFTWVKSSRMLLVHFLFSTIRRFLCFCLLPIQLRSEVSHKKRILWHLVWPAQRESCVDELVYLSVR